jgi:hypothetical protein
VNLATMTPEQLAERVAKIRTALDETWADIAHEEATVGWSRQYLLGSARGLERALAILEAKEER